MYRKSNLKRNFGLVLALTVSLLILSACDSSIQGTATPSPTSTATPLPAVSPTAVKTAPAARIAVQLPDNSVQLVDASGQTTPLAKLDGRVDSASLFLAQNTLGSAIYLPVAGQVPSVVRVDAGGVRKLDWIKGSLTGLAVSATRLAWGVNDLPNSPSTSEIFISGLDGSQVKSILKETYTGVPRALRPLRWEGERLYFSKEPLGLGGYILFGGITSVWSYDARDGKITELVPGQQNALVCIDDLSSNAQLMADHCGAQNMRVTNLADNKTTVINPPANIGPIGAVGGARFSPNGSTLAYALARRQPDNEQGWVAVTNRFSGDSKLVATSPAGDYFTVVAWLDTDTLVLQSGLQTPGVWTVRVDGSNLKRWSDGIFLSLVGSAG